jgi:hypothetical protein
MSWLYIQNLGVEPFRSERTRSQQDGEDRTHPDPSGKWSSIQRASVRPVPGRCGKCRDGSALHFAASEGSPSASGELQDPRHLSSAVWGLVQGQGRESPRHRPADTVTTRTNHLSSGWE